MAAQDPEFEVEEKDLDAMLIAGVRMKCQYSECGKGFALIGRKMGRNICGKPFCLYYDAEYREGDADLEACFPVREAKEIKWISVRELPGGRCVSLIHKGPYEGLRGSYERIFAYVKAKGYKTLLPSREVYIKGPGMILKGNPKRYITDIQIMIEA